MTTNPDHARQVAEIEAVVKDIRSAPKRLKESPTCFRCQRTPDQIDEYVDAAAYFGARITPDNYVRGHDGTFNPDNNRFACTRCYMAIGIPSSPRGWKVP